MTTTASRTVDTTSARGQLATVSADDSPLGTAKHDIARMKSQFELVLPPSIPADRLIRVLQTVVQMNPDLANPGCRRELLAAGMTVAQLGLDPTPAIGHAYIIPFKGKPTFVLGYKGAVWLAADNGVHLKSQVICENDEYDVQLGTDGHIHHRLPRFGADVERGRALAYYCVATFSDGSPAMFEVMTVGEVERIRQNSPGKNQSPWQQHFDEMAKKTVLKRLAKSVPLGVKASQAMAHDGVTRLDVAAPALEAAPDWSEGDVVEAEVVADQAVDPATGEVLPDQFQGSR